MPYSHCRMLHWAELISGLLLLSPLCICLFAQGMSAKKEAAEKSQSTYGVKVNAVVVKATVTDKSGNPVTDLTERDFRVYDDGSPQKMQTFTLESIDPPESEEVKVPDASTSSKSRHEPIKETPARPPRLISIVIDDLTMESAPAPGSTLDFPRMVDAVKKFVKADMGPADQVTILSGSRSVQIPFTDNKQWLLEELDTVPKKLNSIWAVRADKRLFEESNKLEEMRKGVETPNLTETLRADEMSDYEAWVWANDLATEPIAKHQDPRQQMGTEWKRIQAIGQKADVQSRTRNLLYTIRQHLRTLRHFEGAKMVVLFSDGFITQVGPRTGAAEAHQLQELVDLALRSGIILNTVSTRSITADLAAEDFRNVPQTTTGEFNVPKEMDRMMQEQPMQQIASETGGEFFPRSNDMYIGLKSIAHRRHSYYVLTYAMPPHKPDGAYHHIKLEVNRPELELSYRKGYYSPTEELTFETTQKEDIMEALHGPGNMNKIPITLSYNFSQEDDSTYAVSFISNVNVRGMQFPEEDARRRNQISLVLAAFDENDHFISGLEKAIDFQLLEDSYNSLRERGLTSRVELKLPMGRYKIKAVVRENAQGKMGSITKFVEIP
ncbi:MAG: VWA domain-containing protein [Acidobacteria bacterium]|nr:VWA domain-containing protein [Acidobacteriota bacterium]